VEHALTDVFQRRESSAYIMGLSMSDGKLIRPADETVDPPAWRSIGFGGIQLRRSHRAWNPSRAVGNQRREFGIDPSRNCLLHTSRRGSANRWLWAWRDLINQSHAPFNNTPGSSAFGLSISANSINGKLAWK